MSMIARLVARRAPRGHEYHELEHESDTIKKSTMASKVEDQNIQIPVDVNSNGCTCNRPHALVICRACGWMCSKARARRPCKMHPHTMYLMDLEMCPVCHANAFLLAEYPGRDLPTV